MCCHFDAAIPMPLHPLFWAFHILCVSIGLSYWRTVCDLITVPIKVVQLHFFTTFIIPYHSGSLNFYTPKGEPANVRSWPVSAPSNLEALVHHISVCSAISSASSTSTPRYRTVLSSFVWPNRSCTARRLRVRLYIRVGFVRRSE